MAKCNIYQRRWWFSSEVKCDCAKPKRMVANRNLRTDFSSSSGMTATQHYDDATFNKLFMNDSSRSEPNDCHKPSHQDNSPKSDHSHSSCNSSSSYGSSDSGSSSGSDYSSSSSSDY